MMKVIIKQNPNAKFILIASSLPNALWGHANHKFINLYLKILLKIRDTDVSRIRIANLTDVWKEILKYKK